MPADLLVRTKFCEQCGVTIPIKISRDYHRKRFCSRVCHARSGLMGNPWDNPETVKIMKLHQRKPHTLTAALLQAQRERGENRRGKHFCGNEITCGYCGKSFHMPECRIDGRIGRNGQVCNRQYCSNKCRQLASRKPDELKRNSTRLLIWRRAILERDNFTCVLCGEKQVNLLQAAHIKPREKYPDEQYELTNGRTLCLKCHSEESPNRLRNLILSYAEQGKDRIFQVCGICGKQFHRKPSLNAIFCSQRCYHKSRLGLPSWNKGKSMKGEDLVCA